MRKVMETAAGISEEVAFHILDADVQHRRLSQLIDELSRSMRSCDGNAAVVLARLTEYLELHCSDEEQFLETHGCPADLLQVQRAEHAAILDRLAEAGRTNATEPGLADSIRDWVNTHTAGADEDYVEYFRRSGGV
jgi:hemerythrin-like metal-binding protein